MPRQEVDAIFRRFLGRPPSQEEYDGFSNLLDQGTLDPVGLAQYVQSTPEFLRSQAPDIARQFASLSGQFDDQIAEPLLQRGFSRATGELRRLGRPHSSALANAFARVSGDVYGGLAQQRQQQLAQTLNPYLTAGATGPGVGIGAQLPSQANRAALSRAWDLQDYERQKNDSLGLLATQNRWNRQNALINTGLNVGAELLKFGLQRGMGSGGGGTR